MEVIHCTDQAECRQVLSALNAFEVFRPTPPVPVCDGILSIDEETWLCGSNNNGQYTLWMLIDSSHDEAWAFFNNIRGPGNHYVNKRITVLGDHPMNPVNPAVN